MLTFNTKHKTIQAAIQLSEREKGENRIQLANHTDTVACRVIRDPAHMGLFQGIYNALFCIEATATYADNPEDASSAKTIRVFINKNSLKKRIHSKEAVCSLTQTLKDSSQIAAQAWSQTDEESEWIARCKRRSAGKQRSNDASICSADRVYALFSHEKAYVYSSQGGIHIVRDQKQVLGKGGEALVYKGQMLSPRREQRDVARRKPLQPSLPVSDEMRQKLHTLTNKIGIAAPLCTLSYQTRGTHNKNRDRYIELLPYYNQGSLHTVMERGQLLNTPNKQAKATRQLLEGLARLHEASILHRDIKPENILVHAEGDNLSFGIADFGLACPIQWNNRAQVPAGFTTPTYLSLEEAQEGTAEALCNRGRLILATTASDLWQMGITLYQLAHDGAVPEPLQPARDAHTEKELIQLLQENVQTYGTWWNTANVQSQRGANSTKAFLDRLILQMIHPDPKKRPSARTLHTALEERLAPLPLAQA